MSDRPQNATPEPVEDDLPEQMRVRRSKRERLLEDGGAAYPVTVERTHTLAQVRAAYDGQELAPDTRTGEQVAVTGRVMFLRNTGKLCFVRLREGDGTELQVMLSLADVGEREHDLELGAVALAQPDEAELAGVAQEDRAARDRDVVTGAGVGRELSRFHQRVELLADLLERVGALDGQRVRRTAGLEQALTLLATHPHLLGKGLLLGLGGGLRLVGHGGKPIRRPGTSYIPVAIADAPYDVPRDVIHSGRCSSHHV